MSYLTIRVSDHFTPALMRKLANATPKVEHALAEQIKDDTEPFVPALNLVLSNSTKVIGNRIIYDQPYARYLYMGKVMVDSVTGKGPMHFVDKNGNEVIRFPYGSKLKATNRDLVFTKSVHSQAQSHWFEASKAQNIGKWERVAGELMADDLSR